MSRPLLYVLAAILLVCAAGLGLQYCQQHRATRAVRRATQAHAATVAADAGPARAFDSSFYEAAGQRREAHRHTLTSQAAYDSLRHLLPAAGLPVVPARPR